jgi:long-chain acyl-CoA synthetase
MDNVFCDGLKYVQKNFEEYGVSIFVGVPLIVENLYYKVMKQIEKQGKEKAVKTGLKISAFLRKIGIDARRKIFGQIIEKLGGSLRLIICGASALSPEVAKGLNDFGITTIQGYGLTETSPVLSAERPWNLCAGSVGTPMKSVKLKVIDKDENGIGEIIAQGPNVMLGYYNQPEETAKVIKDGWFYTGDLGKIDSKGNLWLTGRKKNVIVLKNGKNVFPEEIEELINKIPYVEECMIFTREKHNELVLWCKFVYKEDFLKSENITEEQLAERFSHDLSEINKILPKYKHVNNFIMSSEPMIKTTTIKIKRRLEIAKIDEEWDKLKKYGAR